MSSSSPSTSVRPRSRVVTIVAIDIAGFSRLAERDEAGAVASVQILSRRIDAVASETEGRIFNTAGDGFMLEFPSPGRALTAAYRLIEHAEPPIRIGIHTGVVAVMPTGDLLGHTVNITARLQQIASPLGIVVSDDVRRAISGPGAELLAPMGKVKLSKMVETIEVHAFGPLAQPAPNDLGLGGPPRRRGRPLVQALSGFVVFAVLGWVGGLLLLGAPRGAETVFEDPQARRGASAVVAITPPDEALWESTLQRNEAAAFREFLKRHPQSAHAGEAAWRLTPDTLDGYAGFLQAHPGSPFAEEARKAWKVRDMQRRLEDDAAWLTAKERNTLDAYRVYLRAYPNGRHAQEARTRSARKRWSAAMQE